MKYEREIIKPLAEGVRLRFRYERGFQPYYSVTLEIRQGMEWSTIRSWDNSHARYEHHLHRHTQAGGREDPELLAIPPYKLRWHTQLPMLPEAGKLSFDHGNARRPHARSGLLP
jgi:hypothetical protein